MREYLRRTPAYGGIAHMPIQGEIVPMQGRSLYLLRLGQGDGESPGIDLAAIDPSLKAKLPNGNGIEVRVVDWRVPI